MLEKVIYKNYLSGIDVEVFTDGYAYDQYCNLYLLSVSGYDSSVKAISSALVSGKGIQILSEDPIDLETGFGQKYRIMGTKLGSGLLHQVMLDDGFFKSSQNGIKLLYIPQERQTPQIVYDTIKRSYAVPLIPAWSDWLYKRIKDEEGLEELSGTRKVLKLTIAEEKLDSLVSEGVRSGEISF